MGCALKSSRTAGWVSFGLSAFLTIGNEKIQESEVKQTSLSSKVESSGFLGEHGFRSLTKTRLFSGYV